MDPRHRDSAAFCASAAGAERSMTVRHPHRRRDTPESPPRFADSGRSSTGIRGRHRPALRRARLAIGDTTSDGDSILTPSLPAGAFCPSGYRHRRVSSSVRAGRFRKPRAWVPLRPCQPARSHPGCRRRPAVRRRARPPAGRVQRAGDWSRCPTASHDRGGPPSSSCCPGLTACCARQPGQVVALFRRV